MQSSFKSKSVFTIWMLFIYCYAMPVYAEAIEPKDSISTLLKTTPKDSSYVNLLNELSYEYHTTDIDKSYGYALESYTLATKLEYKEGESRALMLLSIKSIFGKQLDEAVRLNKKALEIALLIKDKFLIAKSYNTLGAIFNSINDNERSLEFLQLALSYAENDEELYLSLIGNIGHIHVEEGNYELAEKYFDQYYSASVNSSDQSHKIIALRHLADLNFKTKNYNKSKAYITESIELAKEENSDYDIANARTILGKILIAQEKYAYAEVELFEALESYQKIQHVNLQIEIYESLLQLYSAQGNNNKVLFYGKEALQLKKETGKSGLELTFLKTMAEAYEKDTDYKNAYLKFKEYQSYTDSISKVERSEKFLELETAFQLEKKEVENKLLKKDAEADRDKLRFRAYLLGALLIITFLLGFLSWFVMKNLKRKKQHNTELEAQVHERTKELKNTNKELEKSHQDLIKFSYAASHDLKEPIRNIQTQIGLLEKKLSNVDDYSHYVIKDISDNAIRMSNLLQDVIIFSSIIGPQEHAIIDLSELTNEISEKALNTFKNKNCKIEYHNLPKLKCCKNTFRQIFTQLIENGLKYNSSLSPTVRIDYSSSNEYHNFSFTDNGLGIDKKFEDQIFVMFKRLHTQSEIPGSGLGLAIVLKSVEKMNGKIDYQRRDEGGSIFNISIPKA